nr:hypothetical protein [Tanacetum cinerariifolium]
MEKDGSWTPLTPGKPISGGSEDNSKTTASGEQEATH